MRILGVDPGCGGAIAVLDTPDEFNGGSLVIYDMPTVKIRRGKGDKAEVAGYNLPACFGIPELIDVAYVEQVGGMTGQSASAAFNFGRACGAVEYALKALGVRVEMVPPQTWRRALKVNAGKDGSRAMAARLWPKTAQSFARKKDDGRAEAALIAEYGRRQMEGQNANGPRRDESTAAPNTGRNGIFG